MEENENIVSSEEVLTENVIENNENEEKEVVSEILNSEMSEEEQLKLLATDGMLVKRPLVIGKDFVLVGFKEIEWSEIL